MTTDFEVCETGTHKTLSEKDQEIMRLRAALQAIVESESYLSAVAVEIAEKALRGEE